MEQDKPGTSESAERVSHSTDIKILPDYKKKLRRTKKGCGTRDARSKVMPHMSATSPEASSKKAAEAKEEELPQIDPGADPSEEKSCLGTKLKSPVETSNVASENKIEIVAKVSSPEVSMPILHENECVGVEVKPPEDILKPLLTKEFENAISDMILPSSEVKTSVGAKADTSTIQQQAPLEESETDEENEVSPETKRKFIRSRIKYLKKLSYRMRLLKTYMERTNLEIPLPECLDSEDEPYFQRWCMIFECYQNVQICLERTIQMIRRILMNTVENVPLTDIQNLTDILSFLPGRLFELRDFCHPQPHRYRSPNGDFPNIDIERYLDLWPRKATEVIGRTTFEATMFEGLIITSDSSCSD